MAHADSVHQSPIGRNDRVRCSALPTFQVHARENSNFSLHPEFIKREQRSLARRSRRGTARVREKPGGLGEALADANMTARQHCFKRTQEGPPARRHVHGRSAEADDRKDVL